MSSAALTFQIFGRSCVVILPPSLDVPPANDVRDAAPARAHDAQGESSGKEHESHIDAPLEPGERGVPVGRITGVRELVLRLGEEA